MCGIAGVFDLGSNSSTSNQELVRSAISKIQHRGPDEQGYYNGQNCSLGMCRLAIIDVNGGQQPNRDYSARVISVFNGEIYNFKELRNLLIKKGYSLSGTGDSECIPFLYKEYGDDFPKYLNGMFAIALWDEEKKRGLLVRDRFGKKPLWYQCDGYRTSFASELKGLRELNSRLDFDPARLPEYLQFGYINAPRSIYKDVRQLKPGTTIAFDENGVKESRYWEFPIETKSDLTFEEAKSEAKSLITDAVKLRLISERPVGAFLSGGIDSSLVAAIMSHELGAETHSFSIGFSNPDFDESSFARSVANHLGLNHHEKIVLPDPSFVVNDIAQVLDQPFADSSIIPTYLLSKFARNRVVVALGGDGGDEVFGGYGRYQVTRLLDKLNFLLLLAPRPILNKIQSKNRRVAKLIRHAKYQDFRSRYLGIQSLIQLPEVSKYLLDEIEECCVNLDLLKLWDSIDSSSKLQHLQKFDLRTYLPGDLMYKADMASMANSLELRSPILDFRVVEFGLSLPDYFKINNGVSKVILREILYELVPRELVDRPKMGFGIPQAEWLKTDLFELLNAKLFAQDSFTRDLFDIEEIRRLVLLHKTGINQDRILWPILMLELWAGNWLGSH